MKVEAKNIEFNTDRIESQLREKNTHIQQLEGRVRELESELTFYHENPPIRKGEYLEDTTRSRQVTIVDNANIKEYEEQLDMGSKIINKQKLTITQLTA